MFRNYLTYQFAQNFVRTVQFAPLEESLKERIQKSAKQMLDSFTLSIQTEDRTEEARHLFSALINLRDVQSALEEAGVRVLNLESQYEILHPRLERLCAEASSMGMGQLRLLG
jgi:hypothetical protein